jgi:hypothetical protein
MEEALGALEYNEKVFYRVSFTEFDFSQNLLIL